MPVGMQAVGTGNRRGLTKAHQRCHQHATNTNDQVHEVRLQRQTSLPPWMQAALLPDTANPLGMLGTVHRPSAADGPARNLANGAASWSGECSCPALVSTTSLF
jgi:hypothetical protein